MCLCVRKYIIAYLLTGADTGETITVTVSFSGNTGGITSNPTAAVQPKDQTKEPLQGTVAITGTAKVGETLTADISGITNGTGDAAYQWKANGKTSPERQTQRIH
jgi:hypothetical protein